MNSMKRLVLLLSLAVLISSLQDLYAQSLRQRLKEAVFKDPVEIKDKDSTTVVEVDDPTRSSSAHVTSEGMMKAFGLTDNIPHETDYDFNAYIQLEVTNYKRNGKMDDQVLYDNYLHQNDADYAMVFEDGENHTTIIFDNQNMAMLVLSESDGEKTGFATSVDPEAWAEAAEDYAEDHDLDWEEYKPVRTGRTKTILGYKCDEYLVEDEDSDIHMWVSDELGSELRKEWMKNQQTFGSMFVHAWTLNGMVLEYELVERNGQKTVMEVKDIDLNRSYSVNTEDYTIMSLGKQSRGEEE